MKQQRIMKNSTKPISLLIVVIFIVGFASTSITWWNTKTLMKNEALEKAWLVAELLDPAQLSGLKGSPLDLEKTAYLHIKQQLMTIRMTDPNCTFLYLLGQKDTGDVYFFMDAQAPNSESYAPPGLVYDEVSKEYLQVFKTKKADMVGPVTDRWGTLVTSLIPILHPETKELVAVLGMDIMARDWYNHLILHSLLPFSLTVVLLLVIVFLSVFYREREIIRQQLEEKNALYEELQSSLKQVKQLHGILPICAECKKIRDDDGYWQQLEQYISDHSEADFSHSICPECFAELYPEVHDELQKRQ